MRRKLLCFLMMLLAGANLYAQSPGNALNFDGVDDFVSMGNSEAIRLATGVMTLEAWIYPTNLGSTNWGQTILSKTHVVGSVIYGYILRHGTGTAQFLIGTDNNWNLTAVKHGISSKREGGIIRIGVQLVEDKIRVSVQDESYEDLTFVPCVQKGMWCSYES